MVFLILVACCETTNSAAEYVHRVGRTARLEASGKALMMLLPNEEPFVDVLLQHDLKCVW